MNLAVLPNPSSLTAKLHGKINTQDLQPTGFLFSESVIKAFMEYQSMLSPKPKKWNRKQAHVVPFGTEIPRSLFFVDNKIFALYRDQRKTKGESYLGTSHDGCIKLAQNLNTGEWVAVKIVREEEDHGLLEVQALRELKRLIAHISRSLEIPKEYIFESLVNGSMAHRSIVPRRIQEFMQVIFSVLEELQTFHETGLTHGDCGFQNFLYDSDIRKATIIDFETTQKNTKTQQVDNKHIICEIFQSLDFAEGCCNNLKNRNELFQHPHIFEAIAKLDVLMQSKKFPPVNLRSIIEFLKNAYDREFDPAMGGSKEIFPLSMKQQQKVASNKALMEKMYAMPVEEYVAQKKKEYIKSNPLLENLDHLRVKIEEHKKHWRMTGKIRLTEGEWEHLSLEEKKKHAEECKKKVRDRLLREKNSCFWSIPEILTEKKIISIIGDFELLQE